MKYLEPDRELEALRKKPVNVESLLLKNLIHTQSSLRAWKIQLSICVQIGYVVTVYILIYM